VSDRKAQRLAKLAVRETERGVAPQNNLSVDKRVTISLIALPKTVISDSFDSYSGLCNESWEFTIFINTYMQNNCYGIRYGFPDPGHSYWASNDTYFERCE
jgi:hypothetical protein